MRVVVLSLLMGLAVGTAYGIVNVRSPAPPIVALVGLLGMVLGEAVTIHARERWFSPMPAHAERHGDASRGQKADAAPLPLEAPR